MEDIQSNLSQIQGSAGMINCKKTKIKRITFFPHCSTIDEDFM